MTADQLQAAIVQAMQAHADGVVTALTVLARSRGRIRERLARLGWAS
jgi:hypothetical protein